MSFRLSWFNKEILTMMIEKIPKTRGIFQAEKIET